MVTTLTLILFCSLILLLTVVIARQVLRQQNLFGHPPIPVYLFVLAKLCVAVNLVFLFLSGLKINLFSLYTPSLSIGIVALVLLAFGITLLFLSSLRLKNDLIFGLPGEQIHHLQTKGVYRLSRHPFYFGFLFILFSSCLLSPNILNILSFLTAWIIHHFIMIKEEEYLENQYGEEYRLYKSKVSRYLSFK